MASCYLLDGTNLLYRAYHALQGFRTSKGVPTHAAYGFLSMVFRVLREHSPEVLAVVFDPPGRTQKHELCAEYKANREETPEDLRVQIPYVRRLLDALGIPVLTVPGYEADDVLGTLTFRLVGEGHDVTLVTGDKDFCQLVGPRVRLLDTMKDRVTGPQEVRERLGVDPSKVVDLLSLTGDAVDNLPGIPGVGPKTAAQLLEKHGTLERVIARAAEEKGKRGEALREYGARALANRALVTIDTGVPLPAEFGDLRRRREDRLALAAVLRELEFHRFLKDLGLTDEVEGAPERPAGTTRTAPAEWLALWREEASGLWAVARADGETTTFRARAIPPELANALASSWVPIVGHGLKNARKELRRAAGFDLDGIHLDTEVAAYLLAPGRRAYTLADLCGDRSLPAPDAVDTEARAAEGARCALALAAVLEGELSNLGLLRLYREVENPLIPVLADMEAAGVKVDSSALARLGREYGSRLAELEEEMVRLAGEPFSPQSPKQLSHILFDKLNLPVGKKTAKGYSTDASVLEELSLLHPLPAVLLSHRSLAKLKGTFIDVLPTLVDPFTGRIHAKFHQTVTATGRLSSSEPNLQNIPVKGEEGRRIREAFVAEDGCELVSADYSQVELRILAHLCEDPGLVAVFRSGRDVHTETASRLYGVKAADVDVRMRREAKTVNFGILYGISPFGLARQLGIANGAARSMIDAYFHQFPRVRAYLTELVDQARVKGYAETLFGRRRAIPELASRNRAQREFGERMAVNTPIQGTAADIIKLAMVAAVAAVRERSLAGRLILQVHDELVFEVPSDQTLPTLEVVKRSMEQAVALRVPLAVDAGSGRNWYEAH